MLKELLVGGLFWLHPMVTDGTVEATSRPSIGIRHTFMLRDEGVEVALGTGYQSLRGRYVIPPQGDYMGGVIEIERLFADVVHTYWRGTFPISQRHPLFFTLEYELRTNFRREHGQYSKEPDWITGYARMVGSQQERYYLTWATRSMVARLGTDKRTRVEFTLSATF